MIGIYKYTNKINQHSYIGQSLDIDKRKQSHLNASYNPNAGDYDTKFHQAIRKYGIDNFEFEVLAEIPQQPQVKIILNELEKYFIKYYDTYKNGYNGTPGGEIGISQKGTANGRALLTEQDVIYIRECYNAKIPFKEVYAQYQDKISKRGLQKI